MLGNTTVEATEECAISDYGAVKNFELPNDTNPTFSSVIKQYKQLFCTTPGKTSQAYHGQYITTKGHPIHVPPRIIPACYHSEVEWQVNKMLE